MSVEHAAGVSEPLREALRSRIDGALDLPLLPDVAARVLAACQDENFGFDELAELIMHDQSLAAHILRIANSAGFAPRIPILSMSQALGRLGLATIGDVALAIAVKERVFSVPGHQERIRDLWKHSVATASFAREIADLLRKDLGAAFMCGLLHDVGMPIVLQLVCDLEREGAAPPVSPAMAEAAMLEFHSELGVKIAQSWKLGPWISLVILHHHDPARAKYHPDEVPIVALADALAYWAVDPEKTDEDFTADPALSAALRLHEGAIGALLRRRKRVLQAVEAFS